MAETEAEVVQSTGWSRRAPFLVFAAVQLFALVFWLNAGRLEWFYLDEWDFLAQRKATNLGDLFRPHNEHWTTVPILFYRALYFFFGLREYFPYRLVVVVFYLAGGRAPLRRHPAARECTLGSRPRPRRSSRSSAPGGKTRSSRSR